ncbi:hypothetical protein P3S68_018432 [Capsicum galapagoense]
MNLLCLACSLSILTRIYNLQPMKLADWICPFQKILRYVDPTTYASTSDSGKLKSTAVELQQRVGTIAEEFGDFSLYHLTNL